jgi:hypothetical protein
MTLKEKLAEVYKTIEGVAKSGENKMQHYNYVRATDVTKAVREALVAQKVYAEINFRFDGMPYTVAREKAPNAPFTAVNVQCTIVFHDLESTEILTSSGLGSGCDNNDKAAYKAQTGALKYALKNAFLIPDDADPEADESVDDAGSSSSIDRSEDMPDFRDAQRGNAAPSHGKKEDSRPTPASDKKTEAKSNSSTTATQPTETAKPASAAPAAETGAATTSSAPAPAVAPGADGPLPTEEDLNKYRAEFKKLGDDLSAHGKLKSSKGLPINRKVIVFLLSITGAPEVPKITKAQWENFFQRVEAKKAEENGLVNLAKLVNKTNGLEEKTK